MYTRKFPLLFVLLLTFFAACKSSKRTVITLNENVMAKPGDSRLWYTRGNILSKGKKEITLYSSSTLMQNADSAMTGSAYTLNFSPTTLLEMGQYTGNTGAASMGPQQVNAPYYFVTANNRRTLGIWQPDAYRIYLVYRFIAFKDNGGYIVDLVQLQ